MLSYKEVGLRELSEGDRSFLQCALATLGLEDPLIGGLVAEGEEGSPRGILLHSGHTWVVRSQRLPAASSAIALQFFRKYAQQNATEVRCKVDGATLFYARQFFRTPLFLQESIASWSAEIQSKVALQILRHIMSLHEQGLFHGHLSAQNIFSELVSIYLVDAGILFFSNQKSGRYQSVSDALVAGQRSDQSMLLEIFSRHLPLVSLPDAASLLGSEAFLSHIEKQLLSSPQKASTPSPQEQKDSSSASSIKMSLLLGGVLFLFLVVIVYRYGEGFWGGPSSSFVDLQHEWSSHVPQEMILVARKAVFSDDQDAQQVITDSLTRDDSYGQFALKDPLLIATSSSWYSGFRSDDRKALFAFALAPLLRGEMSAVPNLSAVHPGVALALLAGLPEGKDPTRLFQIVRNSLSKLPSLYEQSTRVLAREKLSDGEAARVFRAFLQLVFDRFSQDALQQYLPSRLSREAMEGRLRVLLPTLEDNEVDAIWEHLHRLDAGLEALRWFEENPLAKWEGVSRHTRLEAFFGDRLPSGLSVEQKADLLRAPFFSWSQSELVQEISQEMKLSRIDDFLQVLSAEDSLSRELLLSLLSALNIQGDAKHVFIERWFQANPSPQSVLRLLAALSQSEPLEVFSIPAARYLMSHKNWILPRNLFPLLANHPEPLARGLAYIRASRDNEEQQKVLKRRLAVETTESLRKLLEGKLRP